MCQDSCVQQIQVRIENYCMLHFQYAEVKVLSQFFFGLLEDFGSISTKSKLWCCYCVNLCILSIIYMKWTFASKLERNKEEHSGEMQRYWFKARVYPFSTRFADIHLVDNRMQFMSVFSNKSSLSNSRPHSSAPASACQTVVLPVFHR